MLILGVEGTAHTLSFSIVDYDLEKEKFKVISESRLQYRPNKEELGIKPSKMAEFHFENLFNLLEKTLSEASLYMDDLKEFGGIAYSAGPGFGHTLRQVTFLARALSKKFNLKLYPVNHLVAHLEIGRVIHNLNDEDILFFFVSGANTLISIYNDWYKVLGETLDIGVGNFFDKVGRLFNIPFPAGPKIEELSKKGNKLIDIPYTVKGMSFNLAGLISKIKSLKSKEKMEDILFSLQEYVFAMLLETLERALAYTEKEKLLFGGGVLANKILREKLEILAEDFNVKLYEIPFEYSGDQSVMVATAIKKFKAVSWKEANFDPYWRIEQKLPKFIKI